METAGEILIQSEKTDLMSCSGGATIYERIVDGIDCTYIENANNFVDKFPIKIRRCSGGAVSGEKKEGLIFLCIAAAPLSGFFAR